mgnify:CR=1 FL=1
MGSEGYFLNQFLAPHTNHRTDAWGGSLHNRTRLPVEVVTRIRAATGERWVWLRATGSTAISQLVDSFVVIYVAFVLGPQKWPTSLFLAVSSVNYVYKMGFAIALIPLLYLMRRAITRYLGAERAAQLRADAAAD